tara:strand:- start:152 stop:1120 length:969 start_codon:yes stop_codon:yes gene_type:complete
MSNDNYKEILNTIKFKKINKNGKLKNYLIKSSFASYSSTGNNYSTTNIETLIKNLNLGCRLIHLDINWKFINNKRIPIVTNNNISYLNFDSNYILFEDCCKAIIDYGYNNKNKANYPLILYLNLIYESKYLDVSNRISENIKKYLKEYLLPIKFSYGNQNLTNIDINEFIFKKGNIELGNIIIIKNHFNNTLENNEEKRVDSTSLEELINGYLKIVNDPSEVNEKDSLIGLIFKENYNKYINTNVYNLNSEILKDKLVFLIPRLNNGKQNITNNLYNFNTFELFYNNNIMNFIMNQYISENKNLKIKDDLNLYYGELFKLTN